jgi:chitinase
MKLLFAILFAATAANAAPRILLGYIDNWTSTYTVTDLEKSGAAKRLTHLAYAFANVHNGACALSDPKTDAANFEALLALRQRHPKLKILISVGGANSANTAAFAAAAKTKEGRAKLAASCISLFSAFDGIDLDWEFPTASDRSNFTALLAEFRAQLNSTGRRYLLTIAAPAGRHNSSQMELAKAAAQLDFLNLMTYDYAGNWSNQTRHAAALSSVAATVKDYRDAGVAASKIVLGIPFFGPGWSGVVSAKHGLSQPVRRPDTRPTSRCISFLASPVSTTVRMEPIGSITPKRTPSGASMISTWCLRRSAT